MAPFATAALHQDHLLLERVTQNKLWQNRSLSCFTCVLFRMSSCPQFVQLAASGFVSRLGFVFTNEHKVLLQVICYQVRDTLFYRNSFHVWEPDLKKDWKSRSVLDALHWTAAPRGCAGPREEVAQGRNNCGKVNPPLLTIAPAYTKVNWLWNYCTNYPAALAPCGLHVPQLDCFWWPSQSCKLVVSKSAVFSFWLCPCKLWVWEYNSVWFWIATWN